MVFIAFLVSILIVLVLIGLYRSRKFSPVLIVSLALYMGFWNFFPLLYSTLAKQRTLNIILNSMYIRVAVLQLVSSFVIIVMLYLIGRFRPATPRALRTGRGDISANAVVRLLILTLILIVIMDLRSILTIGYRFAERVQFVVSDINRSDVLGSVLSLAGSYALPFAIACLLARFDKYHRDRRITFLAFGIIALQVTFLIMVGVRAYVLLPIELMMLYLIVNRKKVVPIAKAGIVLLVLGLVIMAPDISRVMLKLRGIQTQEGYDLINFVHRARTDRPASIDEFVLSALDDLYTKFNSYEKGANLLEFEGMNRVGLSLITSSLLSPVPRFIIPTKPVAFSSNGDYSGVPYYYVPSLDRAAEGNVVPVPSSAIAIWELGYLGVGLMIAFNIAYLLFADTCLKSGLLLFRTIGIFILFMPTFEFLIAPTGLIIKEALRILIIVFSIKTCLLATRQYRQIGMARIGRKHDAARNAAQ